jgi:hypothetical protein
MCAASAEMPRKWMVVKSTFIDDDKYWKCELASIRRELDEPQITRTILFPYQVRLGDELSLSETNKGREVFRVRTT